MDDQYDDADEHECPMCGQLGCAGYCPEGFDFDDQADFEWAAQAAQRWKDKQ